MNGVARQAESISPLQRAAILVMYLERNAAKAVLRHLADDEVKRLGNAIAELGEVEEGVVEEVIGAFIEQFQAVNVLPSTGQDFAQRVLPQLLDEERRGRISAAVRRSDNKDFEVFIRSRPARAIAAVLADEHPQVRAVALLRMGPENAARVLACLTDEEQADLTIRMARAERVSPELADDIEAAMRLALADIEDPVALGGVEGTARILGRMTAERNAAVIREVRNVSEDLADDLIRKMVRFEDLERLDGRSIQALLRTIETPDLVLALRGAGASLRERFLSNLSQRAAADIREELELGGQVRRTLIREAQDRITASARKLADEGVIFLDVGGVEGGP
jgi:flagellar motor switch protein FliG